ncbi:MAG: gamma-glutamylcyclotransferase [Cyclobacteriaceae bacterium]|nr:gamma-glutamylcyclotransferase [Cyclobacteriaceae bacterium]
MTRNSLYAFYGSLRRGMELYKKFEPHLQYKFSMWLSGYEMYSLGPYPCIVHSQNYSSKILVEVMEVCHAETEKEIHEIEIDAGYFLTHLQLQNQQVGIYLFNESKNYPPVLSGDWVTFFGELER